MISKLSRRTFLQATASSLTLVGEKPALGLRKARFSDEHGRCLEEFGYENVSLGNCLQQSQLEQTHSVLMGLDNDSLLKPYRERAGLDAPGCSLGGWYSEEVNVGAETFGQWISALSRYYAISSDEATRAKVLSLLDSFGQTVEPSGRIFGNPKVTASSAYHYDKLTCGLMDAHKFAHYPGALALLARVTQAAIPRLPGMAVDEFADNNTGAHESYTLPENQFITWQRGGDSTHLKLAQAYLHHTFFGALARGENVLAGRHAYSHVNALSSAAKAYLVLGDDHYLAAAKNGFAFVKAQSYATGGWGPNEAFIPQPSMAQFGKLAIHSLAESLTRTHSSFETPCGAYAHFKLTRYLLRITKDSTYGDSMERVMYNTVLGAKALKADGRAFYYSDYNMDARKSYFDGVGGQLTSTWPCCSGTLTQIATDYRVSAYFHDTKGVYVNLYLPSSLKVRHNSIEMVVRQDSSYPLSDVVILELELPKTTELALHLRIPAWAQQPSIHVNGKKVLDHVQPGTFKTLKRAWRSGDRIEIELPKRIELIAIDDAHPNLVAVGYGPLVLFAECDDLPPLTRGQLMSVKRKSPAELEWLVDSAGTTVRFIPFWALTNKRYSTYLAVS